MLKMKMNDSGLVETKGNIIIVTLMKQMRDCQSFVFFGICMWIFIVLVAIVAFIE